jgi:DpnII restriction endonuclease
MNLDSPPESYWHCSATVSGNKKSVTVNDLTFSELKRTIVDPWYAGRPFSIGGVIVRSSDTVSVIKITWTMDPQQVFAERHNASMRNQGVADLATDRSLLPIWNGEDCTFDLLFSGGSPAEKVEPDAALIEQVCRRLPQAARILSRRSRKGKSGYAIADEYDVQDLLHGILRAFIKYSVQEDALPKIAGAKSGRADISIEELGILIEIKYVHGPGDQKRLFEEFSQDLVLYAKWPSLRGLIYLVYNSDDLRDPEALEKLSGPKQIGEKTFDAKIILA